MPNLNSTNFTRKHVCAWLGERTLEKGEAYIDRVADLEITGPFIEATVRGTQRRPYKTFATIHLTGDLVSHCSCPVGIDCKHVAAVLLAALREREAASDPERVSPGLVAWITDLKQLCMAVEKERGPHPVSRQHLFYVLEWRESDTRIVICKGDRPEQKRLKPWPLTERAVLQPPRFVDKEDIPILRMLIGYTDATRQFDANNDLIGMLLATERLLAAGQDTVLRLG